MNEPTIASFKAGADPAISVLGITGTKALEFGSEVIEHIGVEIDGQVECSAGAMEFTAHALGRILFFFHHQTFSYLRLARPFRLRS